MRILVMLWRFLMVFLPGPIVAVLSPGRQTYRGASINTKARAVGRLANFLRVPGVIPTARESRDQMLKLVSIFDKRGPELMRVEDLRLRGTTEDGDIAARLYSNAPRDAPSPALVFFHGGGFIQGDLETHDELCRKLADLSGGTVIAVDYRLAPEHPFPAGLTDARLAYLDIRRRAETLGIDPARIGLGGDSAGGCLAAVLTQEFKDSAFKPHFQVLIYPATDSRLNSKSINDLRDGYVIPLERMTWYRDQYLDEFDDYADPRVSPLLAKDFTAMPNSYVLSGGFDPLLDDAEAYVDALKTAGATVTYRKFPGQIHGFVNLTKVIPEASKAIKEIADWMRVTW
jgi:acetyl esterase